MRVTIVPSNYRLSAVNERLQVGYWAILSSNGVCADILVPGSHFRVTQNLFNRQTITRLPSCDYNSAEVDTPSYVKPARKLRTDSVYSLDLCV